ncbi:MAG: phytase [Sporocytophaga sp.]|uniref:phytase n=1 Tax=Sporocytophaga sp. TaxID=2231183 RepID=UPI001B22DC6A|nr:phytase [Sporocytophaga sp.]MBO9702877.1 phytase [Sporocytophaga sp.]
MQKFLNWSLILSLLSSCNTSHPLNEKIPEQPIVSTSVIKPLYISEAVQFDTDDPAIWINKDDPAQSLIIGTDKNEDGALYTFDLKGRIHTNKVIKGLKRPNNVDIEYGLPIKGITTDIAVVTERFTHNLRIYALPSMTPVDGGGIPVFEGETAPESRDLMGIALYKDPVTSKIFAIVGRKTGTDGDYLWQYELWSDEHGIVKASLVRKFGSYSGNKEIEAIAVDDELGYVYYSDEGVGVKKYYANPAKGNKELALFATKGFTADHEGISIYKTSEKEGYILVSDQGANKFQIFSREGTPSNPNEHKHLKTIQVAAMESDGSEITNVSLNQEFKSGLFVVMSTDKTFHYYRWEDIAENDLKSSPDTVYKNGSISLKRE